MAQYMLILRGGEDSWKSLTPEQTREAYQRYFDWSARLERENRARGGNELYPTGRVVRTNGQGIVDGPYAETKEGIGGYFIVEAADYDDAVQVARGCPILLHDGFVEIRECVDHSGGAAARGADA
ncbi:MAG TPA: YciI family protein [Chloroflexota bacterium]|nr:YciI family protein [Chloroflexota bacterium]